MVAESQLEREPEQRRAVLADQARDWLIRRGKRAP
jgi:hypothetical protein